MAEYRPFPEEREDEFRAFTRYAFSPERGPFDPDAAEDRTFLSRGRGLFDGDEPLVVCAHHDFDLRIRGSDRRVGGVSAVASPPEHRRKGLVRELLVESLAEYREDGIPVSVLWPFEYGFYENLGWATASRYTHLEAPPDQLAFAADAVDRDAGTFRRLDADDYHAVVPVLDAMAERYDLTMARTEDWWEHRSLCGGTTDPFVYGYERDGKLRAVISYTFEDGAGPEAGGAMVVSDAAFADRDAWLQLLRFCRNHDSQVETVRIRAPPDADVLDRVDDPRAVTQETRTGPMVRLVDVADALELLEPSLLDSPAGGERTATDRPTNSGGRLDLAVADPIAPWNDGRFDVRVDFEGGEVTASPVAADSEGDPLEGRPTATVDAGTLSQLYVGYLSVDEAARVGGLDPGSARSTLAALFPPRRTHLREHF